MVDLVIFKWLNGFATKSDLFDLTAWVITDYDRVIFAGIFASYFLFHRGETARMRTVILLSVVAGLLTLVTADMFGDMIYRPRPFVVLPVEEARLILPQNRDSSFLSELAAVTVAFAVGMWRAPGHTARWVFTFLALFAGITQVFIGFHWPSDILASAVLGILLAHAVFRFFPRTLPLLNTVIGACGRMARHFRQ